MFSTNANIHKISAQSICTGTLPVTTKLFAHFKVGSVSKLRGDSSHQDLSILLFGGTCCSVLWFFGACLISTSSATE